MIVPRLDELAAAEGVVRETVLATGGQLSGGGRRAPRRGPRPHRKYPPFTCRRFYGRTVLGFSPAAPACRASRPVGGVQRCGLGHGFADFFWFSYDDGDETAALVVDIVARRIPSKFGLDPRRDVQVLCPMHRGPPGRGT